MSSSLRHWHLIAAFIFCCASFPLRATTPTGCVASPSGLVSWWPGDTDNNDIWGSNNPAQANAVNLVAAEVADGFSLGTGGYLQVNPSKSLANQTFTWAAWVKPLGVGPNNDSTGDTVFEQDIDDYSLSVALYWRPMDNRFLFVFGTTGTEQIASSDTFTTGSFYHVAVEYDGTTFRMFVNGMAEGTYSASKTIGYSTNPWTIGSSGQIGVEVGFPRTLNGIVDELQAFNRALAQSELQSIYNAGSAGECKNTTGVPNPPPTTGTVASVNAASYVNPILPYSGIAQGSLFSVFGSNLGPATSPGLSFPLSTTLGGVTVTVSQGARNYAAIPVFVSGSQVNAIMPSNVPAGSVTVTVAYNGLASGGPAQVVSANVGVFTANSSGSGQGIITNASYALIGYDAAAHPGDTLIIWGTGLGPISGSDAEPPPTGNIGSTPTIYFGGLHVTPTYYGRSGCCSGLDQIVFQVPENVTGCNIPVAVESGNTASNFVTVAVAETGNTCSDPSGLPATELSKLAAQGSGAIGSIFYNVYNDTSPGFNLFGGATETSTGTQELATFSKVQFTNVDNIAQVLNNGACTLYTFSGTSLSGPGVLGSVGLDAGSQIKASGGGGQGNLPESSSTVGMYSGNYELPNSSITFTGAGGSGVGAFSVTVPVTAQNLSWTNENSISSITRSSGVNLTWSGADPNLPVEITGFSIGGTSSSSASGAGFMCSVPAGPGQFTVPPEILNAMPASGDFSNSVLAVASGSLGISQLSAPVTFTATGLDLGYALSEATITNSTVTYQ